MDSGLLSGMTDIHCHILPAVDDGVKNFNEAIQSLVWMKKNGVRRLFLTPHVMSDMSSNTKAFLTAQFAKFLLDIRINRVGDIPEMKIGAEYMLDPEFQNRKKEGLLTYADRRVLVETSYMLPPVGFNRILEELLEEGYSPVLAHPERYNYMQMGDYGYLKEQGILFQLNILSLTGAYGRTAGEKADLLLKEDFYNYAGTDFHHLVRHEKSFHAKTLSKNQRIAVKELIVNNDGLW
ncbi:MAG: capsular biosynthesis protein [Tannerella sp.]|nr:capsular biosynthesis protein [Tannerella sp.]